MVKGHKDKKGNFHPHDNSRKGVRSTDFDSNEDDSTKWRIKDPDELEEYADGLKREFIETVETIIKISVPAIAHTDPHFATAYVLFQFAQYGYHFIKKVIENYRLNGGDPYDAIVRQVSSEIKDKIYSHIATKSLEIIIDIITDDSLTKYGRVAKAESITPTKTELEQKLLQIYFKRLLESELAKDETWHMESALWAVSEKLAGLLISENALSENSSSILTGTFDVRSWLQARISTISYD